MPIYADETVVKVFPFSRQAEGDDVVIGRTETGIFLSVPPEAVQLLDWLADGRTISEAVNLYQEKYAHIPDMDDFLVQLASSGIIVVPGSEDSGSLPASPSLVRYHFSNIPQALACRIFSWPVIVACILFVAWAVWEMWLDHSLIPGGRDLFFTQHRTIIWTLLVVVSYGSVIIHEFAHLIAARAEGINSRLGFGNRLWDLVIETDLTGLWAVPKRKRYLPLLAGSLLDAVSGALLVLLLVAHRDHWIVLPVIIMHVVRAMLFTFVTRVLWQTFIFVRTDYYYVIASILNCRNLLADTEHYLLNQLAKIFSWIRPVDQSCISASERRVIPIYAVVWVGGRILAFTVLFSITIPLFTRYIGNLSRVLSAGFSVNPYNFIDSIMLIFYFILPIAIGFPIWIHSLIRRVRLLRGTVHGTPEFYNA